MATSKRKASAKPKHEFTLEEIKVLADEIKAAIKELLTRERREPLPCKELVSGLEHVHKKADKMAAHIR